MVPKLKMIFPNPNEDKGIRYDDPYFDHWVLEIGKKDDLGLINNIIPNLIWKRNVAQSWADFCERFDMPMVTATTNATRADEIDKILARGSERARELASPILKKTYEIVGMVGS